MLLWHFCFFITSEWEFQVAAQTKSIEMSISFKIKRFCPDILATFFSFLLPPVRTAFLRSNVLLLGTGTCANRKTVQDGETKEPAEQFKAGVLHFKALKNESLIKSYIYISIYSKKKCSIGIKLKFFQMLAVDVKSLLFSAPRPMTT